MVDFDYLPKGLFAMARAHRVSTMSGHLGAAVVAGYFIAEQHPDLDEKVYDGIEAELDRIIAGESVFSPRKNAAFSATEMFQPFAKEKPQEDLIDGVAEALARNIGQARESGHNVIFASIAIRGLKDHPDLATPSVVDGLRKLIAGFDNASPGSGYYGKEKGRINGREIALPKDDEFPPHADLQTMAKRVLDELVQHAAQRREGFGGLWHVINHAAALAELARYGYRDLAMKGLPAHHQHMQLFRTVPDIAEERGPETPTEYDPRSPKFWQPDKIRRERAHLTHRIKTIYGFDALAELVEDDKRDQGNHKLRYLM
ncbi:MAG: hypothetical protein RIC55_11640 [Pirellulaceae bacterium]